jgi:hypothetical protein
MKTESEIRAEIQKLKAIAADPRNVGIKPYPLLGAISALRWVLDQGIENCDTRLERSARSINPAERLTMQTKECCDPPMGAATGS